jgi:PDZ domain-containing secreted protein
MIAMAIHAVHTTFTEVHITRKALVLAQIFVPHTAAMAGGARTSHRRRVRKIMAVEQTASNAGWLSNVTIAARSMTVGTVVAKGLFQCRVIFWYAASIQGGPVTSQVRVQAIRKDCRNIGMAFAASVWVTLARTGDQVSMSGFFIRGLNASVAFRTSNVTMYGFREIYIVY